MTSRYFPAACLPLPLLALPLALAGPPAATPERLADTLASRAALEMLWPDGVERPEGLTPYEKTEYNQRTVILDGFDNLTTIRRGAPDIVSNPNVVAPWRASGGLDGVAGWRSRAAVSIPKGETVRLRTEYIEAGARRPLPVVRWDFPAGTVFADLLTNGRGELFELRVARKTAEGWDRRVEWSDADARPAGYAGLRQSCASCHESAGAWKQYGSLIRGGDGVFSWSPFREGTLKADPDKPVK